MSFIKNLQTILISFLGITFVIVIHEFGHFLAAKSFGVKVPVFSIGFGPEIFSFFLAKTKFQFSILLLGGYVNLDPHDLAAQPYLAKMIIILAGVAVNFLFSYIVFYFLGIHIKRKREQHQIDRASNAETEDWQTANSNQANEPVKIEIYNAEGTVQKARRLFKSYGSGFIGPIGIFSLLGKSFDEGLDVFFYLLAIISLNIGIFNLIPLEFFDGGQALSYTLSALFDPNLAYIIFRLINFLLFIFIFIFFMLSGTRRNR